MTSTTPSSIRSGRPERVRMPNGRTLEEPKRLEKFVRIRHHTQATTGWSWKSGSMANSQVFQQYHQMVSSNHSVHSDRQPVGEWLHRKLQGKAPRTAVKRRELRHLGFTGLYLGTQSNQSSDALEVNDTTTFSGSPHETGKIPRRKPLKMSRAAASKVACVLTSIARQSGDSVMDSQRKSLAKGLPWNGLLILMRPAIFIRGSKQKHKG